MSERSAVNSDGREPDFCAPFLEALPVTGAAVSVFGGSMQETTLAVTDALSAKLDQLQFDLGEGPRWEALISRRPVAVPRVAGTAHPGWPVFAEALAETEVQALFVYPLTLGAIDIGVVELYSTEPGGFSHSEHSAALSLAEKTAWSLLGRILTLGADSHAELAQETSPLSRREIHQATGMVLAQAGVSATDALLLLRGHAFSHGQPLHQTASDVVARKLDLTPAAE